MAFFHKFFDADQKFFFFSYYRIHAIPPFYLCYKKENQLQFTVDCNWSVIRLSIRHLALRPCLSAGLPILFFLSSGLPGKLFNNRIHYSIVMQIFQFRKSKFFHRIDNPVRLSPSGSSLQIIFHEHCFFFKIWYDKKI